MIMVSSMKKYMNPVSARVLTACAVMFPVMGVLPYNTMDKMADMSEGFMGWNHAGHSVDYFTWVNLKGSLISIIIGVVLYFGIVRTLLMKKQADGNREYVNRWWKYFDLEDSKIHKEQDEGNGVTYAIGSLFNNVEDILNKSLWRKMPHMTDYRHRLALKYASFKENFSFIGRSLSYGLLLFCLGLCAVLIYLLVAAFL